MNTLPIESIETRIYVFRNQKVMLDMDLAYLYGVEVRTLNQTVKRNSQRFPDDFMFQLTTSEYELLKSQNVISKGKGGRRYMPYAFTQDGIAMLSSVLKSEKAIQVNIQIIRTFNRLRRIISENKDLRKKLLRLKTDIQQNFLM